MPNEAAGRGARVELRDQTATTTLSASLDELPLKGRLPAAIAIWLPNALFGLLGLALLRRETVWPAHGLARGRVEPGDATARACSRLAEDCRRGAAVRTAPRVTGVDFRHRPVFTAGDLLLLGLSLLVASVLTVIVDLLQSLDGFLRIKPPWAYIAQNFLVPPASAALQGLCPLSCWCPRSLPVPRRLARGAGRPQGGWRQSL